jgi:gas vesicle protein
LSSSLHSKSLHSKSVHSKSVHSKRRITEIQWFLAGLAVGGVTTMLLAPRSGRQTRQRLVEKGLEGARTTAEALLGEEQVERGRRLYERGEEIRNIVTDTVDIARRARQVTRPLNDKRHGETAHRKTTDD